ncbi:MAG: tRNA threonylcarbamoyladenosine dehydratase [Mogibacterium sp.]|nr:tRNA threonylcarbamoyladenosine dehydratase [Mogibacterium sp.]
MEKENRYSRTLKLLGAEALERLQNARIIVIGCGGVGSYAAEALARIGIGHISLMDGDVVVESNMNRQLVALSSTLGRNKAEVMAERVRDINPEAEVRAIPSFYKKKEDLNLGDYDWVVDAIDDVDGKTELIKNAVSGDTKIVSSMGAAGKFATHFRSADISETSVCPLARVMRKRLRELGIEHLPVVYSEEKPQPRDGVLGTVSYVPGSAGLELAGYVIRQIAMSEG